MSAFIKSCLFAAALIGALALETEACWHSCGFTCYQSCCYYPCCPSPCWPCCQPDTTPLDPLPPHPGPFTNGTTLYLSNGTYSDGYAYIYLRYRDGCYRLFDKVAVPAGNTPVKTNQRFYQGDHLLIETWSRGTPMDYWHCKCCHLITLHGLVGTFNVINCHYSHTMTSEQTAALSNRATIVVDLPADAKLKFDNYLTTSTSGQRVFSTPALEPGKAYSYELHAEVVRDGKVHSTSQNVTVRAGQETLVNLQILAAAVP